MTKDEALKLALEALKQIDAAMPFPVAKLAIMEAEKALAQPEQQRPQNCGTGYCSCIECVMEPEPVAWGMPSAGGGFIVDCITPEEHDRVEGGYTVPLYTAPPQRTWVGLTPEEIDSLANLKVDGAYLSVPDTIRQADAKLKEKNA